MTENKRFNIHVSEDAQTIWVSDVKTHKEIDFGHFQNAKLLTNLLNELNDENEQLKANYNSLSHNNGLLYDECTNKINALKKENEQLKSEINMLKTTIGRNEGYIDRLTHKGEWR